MSGLANHPSLSGSTGYPESVFVPSLFGHDGRIQCALGSVFDGHNTIAVNHAVISHNVGGIALREAVGNWFDGEFELA
jgi:hypothetical protein